MPRGMRWAYTAIAAVITLAVLSLSYSSYEKMGVERPLIQEIEASSDVQGAAARKDGSETIVEIDLKKVPDLAVTYRALDEMVKKHLGTAPYRVVVRDSGTPELEAAYHSVHFYVEEASVRGTFGEMIRESSTRLENKGFGEYKLSVDKDRIYVQISDENGYLYRIVHREPVKGEKGV
jgi:hypothetical protein